MCQASPYNQKKNGPRQVLVTPDGGLTELPDFTKETAVANPAMSQCAHAHPADQLREPSDLDVAISVARKMLAAYSDTSGFGEFGYAQAHGALSESLRILLRALDAEAGERA